MTTCSTCKHLVAKEDGPRTGVWYNMRCGAVELPRRIDPVTGVIGYANQNDLGYTVIGSEPHPYCRDINNGNCPHYEPKDS